MVLDYFIAINEQSRQLSKMIEMIFDRPYGEVEEASKEIEKEIHVH